MAPRCHARRAAHPGEHVRRHRPQAVNPGQRDGGAMRLEVSPEAAGFVVERGGRLWVWAARPRMCCWGTPAYMYAATVEPPGITGFQPVLGTELEIWFRA